MFLKLFFFIFKSNTTSISFGILQSQMQSGKMQYLIHMLFGVWHLKYLYVIILFAGMEKYPRGRRGGFAKALGRATGAGVRIPPSPPKRIMKSRKALFPGLLDF